jgi:hypothetical protein
MSAFRCSPSETDIYTYKPWTAAAALPAQVTLPAVFPSQSGIPNAVVLGVDSQGHTTYGIEQTEIDGTSTIPFTGGGTFAVILPSTHRHAL